MELITKRKRHADTSIGYAEGKFQEYSDLEIFQMIGRAGRPGFDDSGCAVILTTTTQQRKYEAMISGQEVLEST
jgi:ATP-dependent DNA helicase HFM1/MER3